MCNQSFPDPNINMTFINNDTIFVGLFYNYSSKHYHFIYDLKLKTMVGNHAAMELDCPKTNFTYKAFYNEDKNECYLFYRQGQ